MANEEKVLAECRTHKAFSIIQYAFAALFMVMGALLMVAALVDDYAGAMFVVLGLFLILFGALAILNTYVARKSTYLQITETRITGHKGFIASKTLKAPLSKIQDIEVSDGLMGKVFGYGTIKVTDAGTSGTEFVFQFMEKPHEFADAVLNQIEKAK